MILTRRQTLLALGGVLLAGNTARASDPMLRVAKTPTCGCCTAWIAHMRAAGFTVEAGNMDHDALQRLKTDMGIRPEHMSCHTGVIDGYVIEGHVPAEDVRALLAERPEGLGLSVPGMPIGSPGMEMGDEREPYDTLLMRYDGSAVTFRRHR